MQTQLDNETRNLTDAVEQNIKLKAALEQMNTKCIGLESKVYILIHEKDWYVIDFVTSVTNNLVDLTFTKRPETIALATK